MYIDCGMYVCISHIILYNNILFYVCISIALWATVLKF